MPDAARPVTTYRPSVSHLGEDDFVDSTSRSFFTTRDLGIRDATNGDYGVHVVHAKPGMQKTTGWHYHTCGIQIVYCVRGWEDLAFEDGTTVHLEPGSCINIPPGLGHCETGYSEDFEVIVFTSPAEIATTPIGEPD